MLPKQSLQGTIKQMQDKKVPVRRKSILKSITATLVSNKGLKVKIAPLPNKNSVF
jgi:hypothetical protein